MFIGTVSSLKVILEYFTRMKEIVADSLSDIVLSTCGAINKPQYMPKIPTRSELMKVFDDSFPDCQPYLFRITKPTLGLGTFFT